MDINIDNHIMMLDEAHNIEDVARSAASLDDQNGELRSLTEAKADLQASNEKSGANELVIKFFNDMIQFLQLDKIPVEIGKQNKTDQFASKDVSKLTQDQKESIWLTTEKLEKLSAAVKAISLSSRAKTILTGFITTYEYILKPTKSGVPNENHFRILIKKEEYNERDHSQLVKTNRKPRFDGDRMLEDPDYYHEMQILCMSPAVAFGDLKGCHSILLASGTLSPLDTFESELGVEFKNKVEANHVIRNEQVFCRFVTHGSSGNEIKNTYSNRDNVSMTKDLARLIVDTVSRVTAGGILVFFSSYSVMNKMVKDLKKYGFWDKLM